MKNMYFKDKTHSNQINDAFLFVSVFAEFFISFTFIYLAFV